jgi:hypothetical protein
MQNILRIWFRCHQSNYRNSALYNALLPFWLYFHYAPDAAYLKINPMVQLSIRKKTFRTTKAINFISTSDCKQRKSDAIFLPKTIPYSMRNTTIQNRVTNHLSLLSDLQSQENLENFQLKLNIGNF